MSHGYDGVGCASNVPGHAMTKLVIGIEQFIHLVTLVFSKFVGGH